MDSVWGFYSSASNQFRGCSAAEAAPVLCKTVTQTTQSRVERGASVPFPAPVISRVRHASQWEHLPRGPCQQAPPALPVSPCTQHHSMEGPLSAPLPHASGTRVWSHRPATWADRYGIASHRALGWEPSHPRRPGKRPSLCPWPPADITNISQLHQSYWGRKWFFIMLP